MRFLYDHSGARVKKTVGTTLSIGELMECTGSACTQHLFAGSARIGYKDAQGTHYFHGNHLGSQSTLSHADGTLTGPPITYTPFGRTGSTPYPYKFTGKEEDPETGLYFYGARYYDPLIGRFISPDSIVQAPEDPQSLNRYSYCRNNPLIHTDPTGHFWEVIVGAVIGAALGATTSAIMHRDVGLGALTGAISGAFFGGAGILGEGLDAVTQAGLHATAGAASGAINAGITGGDIIQSAGISAISAGVAKYAMAGILPKFSLYQNAGYWGQRAMEGATAVTTGTVMGGISAEMMGGSFGNGAAMGTWTSAYGFMFNRWVTIMREMGANRLPAKVWIDDERSGGTVVKEDSNYEDPITTYSKETAIPAYLKALTFTSGALVTLGTGSPFIGGLTYDTMSLMVDLATGASGDLPIPGTPISIPDAIHPQEARLSDVLHREACARGQPAVVGIPYFS